MALSICLSVFLSVSVSVSEHILMVTVGTLSNVLHFVFLFFKFR